MIVVHTPENREDMVQYHDSGLLIKGKPMVLYWNLAIACQVTLQGVQSLGWINEYGVGPFMALEYHPIFGYKGSVSIMTKKGKAQFSVEWFY